MISLIAKLNRARENNKNAVERDIGGLKYKDVVLSTGTLDSPVSFSLDIYFPQAIEKSFHFVDYMFDS